MSVLGEGYYWLEVSPETHLPTGQACSAYFGDADKPVIGFWILVKRL